MGEKLNKKSDNGVNGTGMSCEGPSPGRCSPAQQRGPGRHHATARMKWNKEEYTERWYEHVPEGAIENEEVKVLWDINIQCDNVIEARRPDIIVIYKKEHKGIIIDIAVPADANVMEKEKEKVEKYQDLRREIARLWKLKRIEVVPVVIGALGSVTKEFNKWIGKIGIVYNVGTMQDCFVGNCEDIEESVGNVKTRSVC